MRKSDRLLELLEAHEPIYVVAHDTPDPDAIAAGWAIAWLIERKLDKETHLVAGGEIVRAENRHMVSLLQPPLELVQDIDPPPGSAAILVDSSMTAQNHLLAKERIKAVGVIDHHQLTPGGRRPAFCDIRPKTAASATITADYLRQQGLTPCAELATAVWYAIRSETRGCETHFSRLDRSILQWVTGLGNPSHLAEIEDAPLMPEYFTDVVLALQSTVTYGDAALCLLPRAAGPEVVGEVADALIRCTAIRSVLCGAILEGDLVLSLRTERGGPDASVLIAQTLDGLGQSGGHMHRAGGKVPGSAHSRGISRALLTQIRKRFLTACGIHGARRKRLVAKREIIEHL